MTEYSQRLVQPRQTLFGVPVWTSDPEQHWDAMILGVPADFGILGGVSAKTAPAYLRAYSQAVALEIESDGVSGSGWYDYEAGRTIGRGLRICDAGNLLLNPFDGVEQIRCLNDLVRQFGSVAPMVVVLGGDHSLGYWLYRGRSDLALVHIDAHEDATDITHEYPHHGNWVSYLDRGDGPAEIFQLGLRALVPDRRRPPPSNRRLLRSMDALEEGLRGISQQEVCLSIDVDVLDPGLMPAVASPYPGGWHPGKIREVVRAVRRSGKRIAVLDLCEFAPEPGKKDAVAALTLLHMLVHIICDALAETESPR